MTVATATQETAVPLHVNAGRLITGYATAQLVLVAASLRLADHLADGPLTASELAARTDTQANLLARVLRGLAVIGVVTPHPPDAFRISPLGACLSGSGPQSMRDLVQCGDESYRAWAELLPSLRAGDTPFVRAHGLTRYEYLEEHPDRAALFTRAMAGMARGLARLVLGELQGEPAALVVDVGGGNGTLMAELLADDPRRRGVLLDSRLGLGDAERCLQSRGVLDRCRIVEGDFFESVPVQADVYILSHVLHNWDDAAAFRIVENCGRAAPTGATLMIAEPVATEPAHLSPEFYPAVMLDLQMLVMTGGRHRTAEEHESLLRSGGFELLRVGRGEGVDAIVIARRS